ncbi:hypothetical protein [Leptospira gomenensis]|nr:hypothetical protein [Leptospira gomenensis]
MGLGEIMFATYLEYSNFRRRPTQTNLAYSIVSPPLGSLIGLDSKSQTQTYFNLTDGRIDKKVDPFDIYNLQMKDLDSEEMAKYNDYLDSIRTVIKGPVM